VAQKNGKMKDGAMKILIFKGIFERKGRGIKEMAEGEKDLILWG